MATLPNRRRFLSNTLTGSAAFGMAQFGFLQNLPHVTAEETTADPDLAAVHSEVAPLVRLLEETERDKLLERVAEKLRGGTTYRELLAALMLAAVRNVQPRPSVGFKFHAVLVINSAHLAAMASSDQDRWLPIFWAIDYFKDKQIEEERNSGWKLSAVDESAIPPAHKAREAFTEAMQRWDPDAADVAVASLARHAGATEVFDLFARYGGRDFRSIGHKAIFVANSWRTLQCIGWQHAEPVLRSLTYALLNHSGEPNPADSDLEPDRPWRKNLEREKSLRGDWLTGRTERAATEQLIATLREGNPDDASSQAAELLNDGIAPKALWDAVMLSSGEVIMRQPGIIGLHALTTANAMHFNFTACGDEATRRMILLQNCAFVTMFRDAADRRGRLGSQTIADLKPADELGDKPLDDIFATVSRDRGEAARKILTYLNQGGDTQDLLHAARRLVFLKGTDPHSYKYSSAVLEDVAHLSPEWRNTFMALSVFNLRGSGDRDSRLVARTREALG